jgi:hypothetical protein
MVGVLTRFAFIIRNLSRTVLLQSINPVMKPLSLSRERVLRDLEMANSKPNLKWQKVKQEIQLKM